MNEETRRKNAERAKAWREKNPDYMKGYMKKYREENGEEMKAKDREYHAQNKEKRNAYRRQWSLDNPEKSKAAIKAWSEANPERVKDAYLKRRYGITLEEYNRLLEAQGGVCAIHKGPETRKGSKHFQVDHDHATGKVRGLLCSNCNTMLGLSKDNPATLQAAINYLTQD